MEITNEIKAKVFAQYLGQKVYSETDFPKRNTLLGVIEDIGVTRWYKEEGGLEDSFVIGHLKGDTFLLLKPLSSITDEDKIELGQCFNVTTDEFDNTIYKALSDIFINQFLEKGNLTYTVYTILHAFQLLQSKGYDLPQYLLDGKTLKEAGLAIYEEDLK